MRVFRKVAPSFCSLANLTLNGLEKHTGKVFLTTRYADDFVVAGKSPEELRNIDLPRINDFLKTRGLELDLEKTQIYGIDENFDFLGFNFQEYLDSSKVKETKKSIFLVKPSRIKMQTFVRELITVVKMNKNKSVYQLVLKLNQKLRRWVEHYLKVTSQKVLILFIIMSGRPFSLCFVKSIRVNLKRGYIKKYFKKVGKNR